MSISITKLATRADHSGGRMQQIHLGEIYEITPAQPAQESRDKFWKPAGQDTAIFQGPGQVILMQGLTLNSVRNVKRVNHFIDGNKK